MDTEDLRARHAPLAMSPDDFRLLGYKLVDRIADFLAELPRRPVTSADPLATIRGLLPDSEIPLAGTDPAQLLEEAAGLVLDHSLLNGHPRFLGYVTSSPAPIGALGDLLAAAANPTGCLHREFPHLAARHSGGAGYRYQRRQECRSGAALTGLSWR
jgi:hypothetical protein